jgi:putative membrane protein
MLRDGLIAFAVLALAAPAAAQHRPPMPNTAATGVDFVKTAAATDEYERRAGAIAAERGRSPQVRAFGQMMIQAHSQTTRDLGVAAERAGIRVPRDPNLHPGQERMLRLLREIDPMNFDKLYVQQQHEVHMDALGLMRTYSRWGNEAPLRGAAAQTAPIVQQHLSQIVAMQRGMR